MKNIYLVAALLCAAACHRATVPVGTPVVNTEIKNESGQTILAGHASLSEMKMPNYSSWFDNSYNKYLVDSVTVQQVKPLLQNKRIDIFLGSWCGDSKREMPRMIKVLQEAGMDTSRISLVFVDNSTHAYKQSPQHEEKNKDIHHVPSFILYDDNGSELGRIIESPVVSLEKDMLGILQGQAYQPNYRGVEYWRTHFYRHTRQSTEAELERQAPVIKPMCKHYGEFNTYGYVLLASGKKAEALSVFRLNTIMYPDNATVFDSLAEAWESAGNKSHAVAAYEKVLQLQPANEKALKKLNELKGGL